MIGTIPGTMTPFAELLWLMVRAAGICQSYRSRNLFPLLMDVFMWGDGALSQFAVLREELNTICTEYFLNG